MINSILLILIGALLVVLYQYLHVEISHRLNYGKKVFVNRRAAGYVVSCRFNGSKKWFYVDELGDRSKNHYFTREEAIEACQYDFSKDRPKQSVFARAS